MQPGETITPGTQPVPDQQPTPPQAPVQTPVEPQQPETTPSAPVNPPEEPAAGGQFTDNYEQPLESVPQQSIQPVSWTASEYIAHNKGLPWFIMLGLVLAVVAIGMYFVTHDFITAIVVAVAGITFGVFAARQPHVLEYTLDSRGIKIGQKFYPYAEFKSFDVTEEGPLTAILLEPLKRFLPPITVFYDQNEEEAIFNVLGNYLPHQEKAPDAVDRLMRRIRF
jgi:hypothetical protein